MSENVQLEADHENTLMGFFEMGFFDWERNLGDVETHEMKNI